MLGAKPPSSLQSSLHGAHSKRNVNVPEVGTPFFVHLYSLVSNMFSPKYRFILSLDYKIHENKTLNLSKN